MNKRIVTTTILLLALSACGGGPSGAETSTSLVSGEVTSTGPETPTQTTMPDSVTTSTPEANSTVPAATDATIPADFPVPIMDGGEVESAYPTEVTLIYPSDLFDALIDYYDGVSSANDGTSFDLFPDGRQWDIQGIEISVTSVDRSTHPDRPEGVVLFIRLH